VAETHGYRTYAVAFLTQLKYLDFMSISREERMQSRETGVSIEELKAVEGPSEAKQAAQKVADAERQELQSLEMQGLAATKTMVE